MTVRDLTAGILLATALSALSSNYPISPVFLAVALTLALLIYSRTPVALPTYTIWCVAYLTFAAGSALASGMPPVEFLKYDFYRYDGNAFASFLPFLIAPALEGHRIPALRSTAIVVMAVSAVLFAFQILAPAALFKSHNALGGFASVILVTNIMLLGRARGGGLLWVALLLNIVSLVLSTSRGSLLGVILTCSVLFLHRRGWKKLAYAAVFGAVLTSFAIAALGYNVWSNMGRPEFLSIDQFSEGMELAEQSGQEQVTALTESIDRGATVAHRVFFIWPIAVDDFLSSPIVGIGFGRFDDMPPEMVGMRGVLMMNETPNVQHTDGHAHNSFLQVAAETGVVGLILITGLLISLWRAAERLEEPQRSVVRGLLLYVVFSSCTEHRLTTPAQMIPAASLMVGFLTSLRARIPLLRTQSHAA